MKAACLHDFLKTAVSTWLVKSVSLLSSFVLTFPS